MMWSYTFYFYPRPPRGGRRPTRTTTSAAIGFLSTPSARRATLLSGYGRVRDDISIHALREEGDRRTAHTEHRLDDFYPRPPRGGRLRERFIGGRQLQHFYPRPPRGGRHHQPVASSIPNPISIHALREEGDAEQKAEEMKKFEFLSTPSARRATRFLPLKLSQNHYFYPRPPRGGRPTPIRPSSWRRWISIHALREEGDFYFFFVPNRLVWISIHALREEGDIEPRRQIRKICLFLSTPSARRATSKAYESDR